MNISLQLQYLYLNWRRKVQRIWQLKLIIESKGSALAHAPTIFAYVISGNTIPEEMKKDYDLLVSEYGLELFALEESDFNLFIAKEEDKLNCQIAEYNNLRR